MKGYCESVDHVRTSDDSISSRIITILCAAAGRGEINAPNRGRRPSFLLILIMLILFLFHRDNVNIARNVPARPYLLYGKYIHIIKCGRHIHQRALPKRQNGNAIAIEGRVRERTYAGYKVHQWYNLTFYTLEYVFEGSRFLLEEDKFLSQESLTCDASRLPYRPPPLSLFHPSARAISFRFIFRDSAEEDERGW